MRTRPGLKSCLKITPPISPDLSAASSPCGSGRTSPALASDGGSSVGSGGRKTVSFCSQAELEEIYFADDWDRSPAAVTPKLSYQDILELKQLRISLPYTPPPPTSRQPFTTSTPSAAGPSNKPPFPVSRFATGPSYTPSKWKNRSQPQHADPEILPYLDAVPIRLLPLLPQSPTEPTPSASLPEPHPQTPTPTASPERRPAPPPPVEPPEIKIEPTVPAPASPPSPVRTRISNFAFMPLLPVQDPAPAPPPPVVNTSGPVRPRKTFNMTFLPVNAVPESESLTASDLTLDVHSNSAMAGTAASASLPSSSSAASGGDPRSNDAHQAAVPSSNPLSFVPPPTSDESQPSSTMSLSALAPSLSLSGRQGSLSESDNETDTTDTYASDTDAESDAPSTSTLGSSLHSPPLDDDLDAQARLEEIKLGTSDIEYEQTGYVPRVHTQDPGSYFPPVPLADVHPLVLSIPTYDQHVDEPPALPSGPGQTPPLSVLYPSPTSQHSALSPHDAISSIADAAAPHSLSHPQSSFDETAHANVDAPSIPTPTAPPLSIMTRQGQDSVPTTPLALSLALKKKIMLEALPSPALNPPSPFALDPLDESEREDDVASSAATIADAFAALGLTEETAQESSAPSASVLETPKDSPMLTLESMRATWDASARAGLGLGTEMGAVGGRSALAPSLSRRRMS